MKNQLDLVKQFHRKFRVPVLERPAMPPEDRWRFRHQLMAGEVAEYLEEAERADIVKVSKELADILFAVYGTILEHGLQDQVEAIFEEVFRSNMSKDYHEYKVIKGANYFEPDLERFFQKEPELK